jgi:glycosyltransferase involved in cell wall biosynthesis
MTTESTQTIKPSEAHAALPRSYQITVVMPCLNEAETLAVCIRKAKRALEMNGIVGEVIVADNGSTDGSQQIAMENGARLVNVPLRGYGAALMAGIKAANAPFVLMADADDSYDFDHIPRFLDQLNGGVDLVMGNRFQGGVKPGAMPFLHKYLGNPVLSLIGQVLFGAPVKDFHCGIRGFTTDAFERMNLRTTGMEFASEMVVKATLLNMNIVEVATTLSPDGRSRSPHLRTWRDGWRHLRFLLLYSPRWLFLYPGLFMMMAGGLASAWLLPRERSIGSVHLDVDTLLYAFASLLIGFHATVFSVSAKVFAIAEGLLPEDPRFSRWFRYITLETGLLAGLFLLLIGLGGTAYALLLWKNLGFGPLSARTMLRLTMPSAVALMLSAEIFFSSFFLSMMGMSRENASPIDPARSTLSGKCGEIPQYPTD